MDKFLVFASGCWSLASTYISLGSICLQFRIFRLRQNLLKSYVGGPSKLVGWEALANFSRHPIDSMGSLKEDWVYQASQSVDARP